MGEVRSFKAGPGARLRWLEAVATHPETTSFDVVVALGISRATDATTGKATISQVALKNFAGAKSDRGVRGSIERLADFGLLKVDRTEIEKRGGDRRKFGGAGRGLANVYEPVLPSKNAPEMRNGYSINEERPFQNRGTAVPHTPNSPIYSPVNEERPFLITDDCGLGADRWKPIRDKLTEHVGQDLVASWFGKVRLKTITDTEIVIEAPTKFNRQQIENRFGDALVRAARAADPDCTVTRARVVLAEPLKGAAQ